MLKKVNFTMGGDPEFFFKKGGQIIGSEKVIPAEGLIPKSLTGYSKKAYVVRDGIQVELNPAAGSNPAGFANNIKLAFEAIAENLKGLPGVSCDFTGTIDVTEEEFLSLDPNSRILGCKPSKNIYGHRPILVDYQTFRTRSAGGHYHFGLPYSYSSGNLHDKKEEVIAICDIVLGNTMVLLDRDLRAAERRENYGRAGEYREPPYGVEYRTLSNFWLKNYTLLDLVFGLGQVVIAIASDTKLVDQLVEVVTLDNFAEAINTNNFDMALANFNTIRPFLVKNLPKGEFVLDESNIDRLLTFADSVNKNGLDHFFNQDPMTHWVEGKFEGVRDFLQRIY